MSDETRISAGAVTHGLGIAETGREPLYVHSIWTTHFGDWDNVSTFGPPAWARREYLRPLGALDYFDEAGADHHLFVRVEDAAGNPIDTAVEFIGGSLHKFANTGTRRSGWASYDVYPGSRWRWGPVGGPHVTGGNPGDGHISCFAVVRQRPVIVPVPVDPLPAGDVWTAVRVSSEGDVREVYAALSADGLIDRIIDGMDVGVSGVRVVTQE